MTTRQDTGAEPVATSEAAEGGPAVSTEPPLVRCEPGRNGPRIIIAMGNEEWALSVARAARLRDALTPAIAAGLAEAKRMAAENLKP